VDIARVAGDLDAGEALVDEAVVVVPARRVVAPQVEAQEAVEVQCRLLPLLELGGVAQDVEPDFDRAATVVPLEYFLRAGRFVSASVL